MTDTTLFGETPPVPASESKYATWDADALRKKAEAADLHIRTLEAEAAARREAENNTATLEEVLRRLDTVNQPPVPFTPPVVTTPQVPNTTSEHITKQDVLSILEQKQKELQAKANVDSIKKELQKAWGDDFPLKLKEKSKQLDVSQEFLASMAETHPQAFIKLVMDGNTVNANPNAHVPPTTTIRTKDGLQVFTGEKMKDYQKAMKDNPHLRADPAFNKRMHESAERLGASFFN